VRALLANSSHESIAEFGMVSHLSDMQKNNGEVQYPEKLEIFNQFLQMLLTKNDKDARTALWTKDPSYFV
jgi:hypothetical protein